MSRFFTIVVCVSVLVLLLAGGLFADVEVVNTGYGTMNLTGYARLMYDYILGDEGNDSFSVRPAVLGIKGDIYEYVGYKVNMTMSSDGGGVALLDGYGMFKLPYFDVKLGQFHIPFGKEEVTSTPKLLMIDRAQISTNITPIRINPFAIAPGRDLGVQGEFLYGHSKKKPLIGAAVGFFNGEGRNVNETNDPKDLCFRVRSFPIQSGAFNGLEAGFSYLLGKRDYDADDDYDDKTNLLNFYGGIDHYHFTALFEYQMGKNTDVIEGADDQEQKYNGFFFQGSYKLHLNSDIISSIEPCGRYDVFDPNTDVSDNKTTEMTFGCNLNFAGFHATYKMNFVLRKYEAEGTDDDKIIKNMFQVAF